MVVVAVVVVRVIAFTSAVADEEPYIRGERLA